MVVSHAPLQTPGGPELLIIALVVLIPLMFLSVLVVGVFALVRVLRESAADRASGADPDRVAELEQRVEELERRLDGREQ